MEITLTEVDKDEIKKLEPQLISALLDKWQHVKKTGAALEKQAKALLEEGGEIPNWGLKEGNKVKAINEIETATKLILEDETLDVSPSDLLAICTFPIGKLLDLIIAKTGSSKQNAEKQLEETLGEVLTFNQNKPSLKRSA